MLFIHYIVRVSFHLLLIHPSPRPEHDLPGFPFYTRFTILDGLDHWNYPIKHPVYPACCLITSTTQFNCGTSFLISIQVSAACKSNYGPFPGQNIHFAPVTEVYSFCSMPLRIDTQNCVFASGFIFNWCSFPRPFWNLRTAQSWFRRLLTCMIRIYSCQNLTLLFMCASLSHFDRDSEHVFREPGDIRVTINILSLIREPTGVRLMVL